LDIIPPQIFLDFYSIFIYFSCTGNRVLVFLLNSFPLTSGTRLVVTPSLRAVLQSAGLGGGLCHVYDPQPTACPKPPTVPTTPGLDAALHRHPKPIRAAECHHGIATPRQLDPSSERWPTPELRVHPKPCPGPLLLVGC
jgi:hypothetical protein